jgi:hypothetical protein
MSYGFHAVGSGMGKVKASIDIENYRDAPFLFLVNKKK